MNKDNSDSGGVNDDNDYDVNGAEIYDDEMYWLIKRLRLLACASSMMMSYHELETLTIFY